MNKLFFLLRAVFITDFFVKLLCIGLAYLIWSYVSDQYSETRTGIAFAINFDTDDEVVVQSDVHEVTATLKGSRGSLMSVISSKPSITYKMKISVDDMKQGATRQIKLTRDVFNLPPDVYISDISPKEFTVNLGTEPYRYIPVQAHIINRDKAKYPFEVKVYPTEARVYGPSETLNSMVTVHTDAIDVSGREVDFSRHVKIAETQDSTALRSSEVIRVDVHFIKTPAGHIATAKVETHQPRDADAAPEKVVKPLIVPTSKEQTKLRSSQRKR